MGLNSGAALGPPGWYGKLPGLGDFASRRMDLDLVEVWDHWLAAGMQGLREADPAAWLDAYLAGPIWRFLLMPGAMPGRFGGEAWAGILMPSVDKVGRYFPFSIVFPLGAGPASTQQMQMLWQWLARLDEVAGDALHDDWTVERLETELSHMQGPDLHAQAPLAYHRPALQHGIAQVALPDGVDAAAMIGLEAQSLWKQANSGISFWNSVNSGEPGILWISRGLPSDAGILLGKRDPS